MSNRNLLKLKRWAESLPASERFTLWDWDLCYMGKFVVHNKETLPREIASRVVDNPFGPSIVDASRLNSRTGEVLVDQLRKYFNIPDKSNLMDILQGEYVGTTTPGNRRHLLECIEVAIKEQNYAH